MSERRIVIVANGGANIASLQFALQRLEAASVVSADAAQIRAASHVILPGVGAAADAMARLRQSGLDALIPTLRQPVLGICLGMQLLFEASQEGDARCLGIIPGRAARIAQVRRPAGAAHGLEHSRDTPTQCAARRSRRRRLCLLRAQLRARTVARPRSRARVTAAGSAPACNGAISTARNSTLSAPPRSARACWSNFLAIDLTPCVSFPPSI